VQQLQKLKACCCLRVLLITPDKTLTMRMTSLVAKQMYARELTEHTSTLPWAGRQPGVR
jgi:hypothetical protein